MNLRDSAKRATTLSELMNGRAPITTEELVSTYPNGITVQAVDWLMFDKEGKHNEYPIFVFKECENRFYGGGCVLSKIVSTWIDECKDVATGEVTAIELLNSELSTNPVVFKLSLTKNSKNQNLTSVEIL